MAEEIIPMYFWVDNFDIKVERLCGSGIFNTTHLMAFQEPSISVTQANVHTPVTTLVRTGRRKLSLNQDEKLRTTHKIDPNAEPPKFNSVMSSFGTEFGYPINQFYFLWLFLRRQNHIDQIVPTFSGWQLQNRQKEIPTYPLKKTVETYLPPIPSKVVEFTTIETYLEYLEKLSMSCNMPFVNITLDVGAAMNAYKFVWSNPERFKNVVTHLGDFHFIKENFQVSSHLVF